MPDRLATQRLLGCRPGRILAVIGLQARAAGFTVWPMSGFSAAEAAMQSAIVRCAPDATRRQWPGSPRDHR